MFTPSSAGSDLLYQVLIANSGRGLFIAVKEVKASKKGVKAAAKRRRMKLARYACVCRRIALRVCKAASKGGVELNETRIRFVNRVIKSKFSDPEDRGVLWEFHLSAK